MNIVWGLGFNFGTKSRGSELKFQPWITIVISSINNFINLITVTAIMQPFFITAKWGHQLFHVAM